jgi:hypothetical protein
MTSNGTDGRVDQLVKARWLALGLSQKDLAEVLDTRTDGAGAGRIDLGRLRQVADALGISTEVRQGRTAEAGQGKSDPCATDESLQSLLELRMLRVFRELQDQNTKRMLIELTEQIVRRQSSRHDDAS